MIGVGFYESKTHKNIYRNFFKNKVDPKIEIIWVAILENVARIWKLISKRTSKLPGYVARKAHLIWDSSKNKIDYLFEKIHRNPKVF
jgi:hypothetical protein